jgi:hypothetical protein
MSGSSHDAVTMTEVPEGAQRSDDGQWWWDGQDWQPVPQDNAAGGQEAARVAQGMPAALTDLTDDHRSGFLGEPTIEVETVEENEVEVLAMQDTGEGGGSWA